MTGQLFRIAELAFNRPLLIEPEAAAIAASVLLPRIGAEQLVDLDGEMPDTEASAFVGTPVRRADGSYAGYRMAGDGVAIAQMRGKLVNRGAWIGASSGLTSYEGLGALFSVMRADTAVSRVVLDVDSPGGEAAGAFEAAAALRALDAEKPVTVLVNAVCCSAAFLVSSGASEILVTPTASVGSVGVIIVHLDRSASLEKAGLRPTIIHAGAGKADFNPFEPLPEAVRADVQREVDTLYGEFVATVAAHRPKRLTEEAIRTAGARVFRGRAAVEAGLADRVATLDDILKTPAARSRAITGARGAQMSGQTENQPAPDAGIPRAEHEAALTAARTEARAEGVAEGQKAGATAERARLKGIMALDGAKVSPAAALALALDTDVSADQAAAVLAAAPAPKTGLAQAMAGQPDHDLGPGTKPGTAAASGSLADKMAKRFGAGARS
ncbi:S49 family peptidase [Bosea sp. TWI1241]|uniref:S49 family peptidase n=1 Tax=Bosea sp. TWI1241 TaxID=3148904 RepID=UPI00320924D5